MYPTRHPAKDETEATEVEPKYPWFFRAFVRLIGILLVLAFVKMLMPPSL